MSQETEVIGVVIFLVAFSLLRYADEQGVLFTTAASKPHQVSIIVGTPEELPSAMASYYAAVAADSGVIPLIFLVFE
jgi:hypothetical protein